MECCVDSLSANALGFAEEPGEEAGAEDADDGNQSAGKGQAYFSDRQCA